MDVSFVSTGADDAAVDAAILVVFEERVLGAAAAEFDARAGGAITRALAAGRSKGKPGDLVEVLGVDAGAGPARLVLIGLGAKDKASGEIERAVAGAIRHLLSSGAVSARLYLDHEPFGADAAASAALGARLAAYRYDAYKTKTPEDRKPSLKSLEVIVEAPAACESADAHGAAVARGVHLARDLVNAPPNALHPESYADQIARLGLPGLEVEVLDEAQMHALGMHALLGVGRGSARGSRLVVMRWNGGEADAAPLALIGKGVTFDTGGISLKPGPGMEEMRGDMGGSAAVVGAMVALAHRKAKANVVGVVGLVENMPDGEAQRPGDIVTSMSGQTIEILNTDAEGRLVLADALWYAKTKFAPVAMIDLATLTGLIVLTFGNEYAGLFSNDDGLADSIARAGRAVDEPLWRMPMGAAYDKLIDTPNADMKNIGTREAGSITAAQFLARFVDSTPWAHLDIASTAWKQKNTDPRTPGWATGYGVRLLDRLVADRYEG